MPLRTPRPTASRTPGRLAWLAVVLPALTAVALAGPSGAVPGPPPPSAPAAVVGGVPTAPMGGPVDDGWLPGTGGSPGFAQFEGEPPPAGDPVWPGVRRDVRRTQVGAGLAVDVQVLHLDPDADVQVRPTLAGGSVRGIATVAAQSGDPLEGAVAAVNGGFWLGDPFGEPNGFFAVDGRLVSDAETQGAGPRGTIGWTADGRVLIDRVDTAESVALPDGTSIPVAGLNRGHRQDGEQFHDGPDALLAYTPDYGGTATLELPRDLSGTPTTGELAVVRLEAGGWPVGGAVPARVTAVERDVEGVYTPRDGEVLLLATGARATALDAVAVGDVLALATRVLPTDPALEADWAGVTAGLASGPHIVEGGQLTDPAGWVEEGFVPSVHSDVRAPRSAAGVTADGRLLLVVADGRRPGITHGFTIAELGRYMIALGAVDALSLDGGASSQLVVDGILRNVPCCDSTTRAVATSLQVVHDEVFEGTDRLRGDGRVDTAAAVARHAFPDGAPVAVLAAAPTFPDALAGGPLAAAVGGPLLLTGAEGLPAATTAALLDLGVRRVVVLGGEGVVGPQVLTDLAALGVAARRVAGQTRFETAAAIADVMAEELGPAAVTRAFLTGGSGFADALVAAGPGGILDMPVLLTGREGLHPAARAVLRDLDEVVVVGGTAQVPDAVAEEVRALGPRVVRLAGDGRFGTAAAVNRWLAEEADLADGLVVATGGDFPDALAGGPLAARLRVPLMIVPGGRLEADPDAAEWFDELGRVAHVDVVGGLGAVSSYQQWQLEQRSGPCPLPAAPLDDCGALPDVTPS